MLHKETLILKIKTMWESNICASLSLICNSYSLRSELKALLSSSSHKNNSLHQTAHWPPVLPQICTHSSNQCIPLPFTEISSSREQHSTAQQQARHVCWRLHNGSASKHTSLKALGTNTASSGGSPGVVAAVFFFPLFVCMCAFLSVFMSVLLHCCICMLPYQQIAVFVITPLQDYSIISFPLGKIKHFS